LLASIQAAEERRAAIALLYATPGFFEQTSRADVNALKREDAELGAKIDGWMTEWEGVEKELAGDALLGEKTPGA
jgi:hypothetical protein